MRFKYMQEVIINTKFYGRRKGIVRAEDWFLGYRYMVRFGDKVEWFNVSELEANASELEAI